MTAPAGPYRVVKHWTRWSLEHVLDWTKAQPIYDTQAEAQAEADRRNQLDHARRTPKPAQPDLFSKQETA